MKKFMVIFVVMLASFFSISAFAIDGGDIDFLSKVLDYVKGMGGLSTMAKIAGGITLLLSTMKVSFLKPLWEKLGEAKAWAAPVLGLVAGILATSLNGKIEWAGVVAYVGSGAGALILHELLDTIKAIPKLGTVWVTIIEIIKGVLGGNPKTEPVI